jgi:exodeoxyribonuclease V alpha subunit
MNIKDQSRLYDSGILSELDTHFARFIARLDGTGAPELFFAAALISSYTRQGHICIDLESKLGPDDLKALHFVSGAAGEQSPDGENGAGAVVRPELSDWPDKLRRSPVVGKPGEFKPLILDDRSRLYLYRYWDYQQELASLIRGRVSADMEDIDVTILKKGLERLFGAGLHQAASKTCTPHPADQAEETDWQKVAAFAVLVKRFCIISGGPGTGKTTTVAKILALVLEQPNSKKLRIALAAPTGKAAARLQEAIKGSKEKLDCPENIKEEMPEEASTIHRLLGSIPDSPYFRHNAQNRLPVDVVVVDEASMVDLALMSKLIQALPSKARLILLGDKDQLASVEPGAVLGDICDTGNVHSFSKLFLSDLKKITGYEIRTQPGGEDGSWIQDCIVQLKKSFRFGSDSGINAVSRAVTAGDVDLAVTLLMDGKHGDIKWKDLPPPDALPLAIKDAAIKGFKDYLRASDIRQIFQLFDRFRIMCALRKGPYGVIALNFLVEQILNEEGLIQPDSTWYPGRPLLITRNDYNLRLFNGDVGIVLPDAAENNDLRAFFPTADGMVRKFSPLRLPEHETVYAMTVHKSQGSEFDKALLLLPDRDSPVLTRELIYTGITRARESVEIWGSENVFRSAVSKRIKRTSGLRDALWMD